MARRRSTRTGHSRSKWSLTMSTAGLTSTRTTSTSSSRSSQRTQLCSRSSRMTARLSLTARIRSSGMSYPAQTRLHRSGVIQSFSFSTAGTRMTSKNDLTTSSGSNSGTLADSMTRRSETQHRPRSAHSCFCGKRQAGFEKP